MMYGIIDLLRNGRLFLIHVKECMNHFYVCVNFFFLAFQVFLTVSLFSNTHTHAVRLQFIFYICHHKYMYKKI